MSAKTDKHQKQNYSTKPFNGKFHNKDFISINQLSSPQEIKIIFKEAEQMRHSVESQKVKSDLCGYCIAELFYQPSTRTYTSFLAAIQRLGAYTIPIHGMSAYSSAVKGESLRDTIRTIEQTTAADLIVLRHPEDNSSAKAAHYAKVPIVNAGSGKKEHPTQAILDLYTIWKKLGRMNGLHVVMLGDLKYGRTVKSLSKLLALVDKKARISFVSPPSLRLPAEDLNNLRKKGVKVQETDSLVKVLPKADVLYVTRVQKEWFEAEGRMEEYNQLLGQNDVAPKIMKLAKRKMIVMHPLPRVGEITYEVDKDPRAVYINGQMSSGLYTRMALLKLILKGVKK